MTDFQKKYFDFGRNAEERIICAMSKYQHMEELAKQEIKEFRKQRDIAIYDDDEEMINEYDIQINFLMGQYDILRTINKELKEIYLQK